MPRNILDNITKQDFEWIDSIMKKYNCREGQGLKPLLTYFLAEYKESRGGKNEY